MTTRTSVPEALARALRQSWSAETCAPEGAETWNPGNPARDQCITTVLVVHDVMGGELVRGEVHVGGERVDYHWWNRLPDGSELDLTREQFADHERIIGSTTVARPNDGGRVAQQYEVLRGRVDAHLRSWGYVTRPRMTTAEARAEFAQEDAPAVKPREVEDGEVFQ